MPKTTKTGSAKKSELPSTLQRSGRKAQQTFAETYDSAMDQYDDERRSYQTAFASLKHTHEKVGDHWEPKDEYGPSDAHAAAANPGTPTAPTAGGVDANATQEAPLRAGDPAEGHRAVRRMTKAELVDALQKANDRASAQARS